MNAACAASQGPLARGPESEDQAKTWDKVKHNGVAYGLCHSCASQVAWGHQLGFRETTRRPCVRCIDAIAALPLPKPNGWRTVKGRATRARSWPNNRPDGDPSRLQTAGPGAARGPHETGGNVA